MKFLLIAPIKDASSLNGAKQLPPTLTTEESLTSRDTSKVNFLAQHWDIHFAEQFSDVNTDCGEFHLEHAWKCTTRDSEYCIMIASSERLPEAATKVAELEKCLSHAGLIWASAMLADTRETPQFPWVARYALVEGNNELPENWLHSAHSFTEITSESGVADGSKVKVSLGWGNGAIIGWRRMDLTAKYRIVEGLIDAQVIWNDLQRILESNEGIFTRLLNPPLKRQKRFIRNLHGERSVLEISASKHQLFFDELIQSVQGTRRICAELLLISWGYERSATRMLERVKDTALHVDNLRARSESRYQSAVQIMLIALGFMTIVDTCLALLSTAFSGGTSLIPNGSFGLFSLIRSIDADAFFGMTILLTIILTLVFTRRR